MTQPAARRPSEREVLASLTDSLLGAARYLMPHDLERVGDGYRLTLSVRVDAGLLSRGPDPIDFGELLGTQNDRELRVAGFGVTAVRDKGYLDTPEGRATPWRYYAAGADGLYREISRSEDTTRPTEAAPPRPATRPPQIATKGRPPRGPRRPSRDKPDPTRASLGQRRRAQADKGPQAPRGPGSQGRA